MMLQQIGLAQPKFHHGNPFFNVDDEFLANMLMDNLSIDPYMQSMAYIKMTSRKGLRGYKGVNATVLFSMHPNCDKTYIIYPLNVAKSALDILDLAHILKQSGKKVEVIRLSHTDVNYLTQRHDAKPHREKRLDYTYPVHILNTREVLNMRGKKFNNFRTTINVVCRKNIDVVDLSFSVKEKEILKEISMNWANLRFKDNPEENCLFMFHVINSLVDAPEVKGIISYIDKEPAGFSLWEIPLRGKKVANSMVHCTLYETGLAEFLYHEVTKSLCKENIDYLCLGGAETEGLDFFKRKMNPINSIELVTMTL